MIAELRNTLRKCLSQSEEFPICSQNEVKKMLIEETIRRHKGNKTRAAKTLGISIRTIRLKCKEYGL